jgi:DNA-binding FrmR family transcriptional regulator
MHGYTADKDAIAKRLARIEGQVRGIAAMVDADRYCIDVVTQIQAARAALSRVETELLRSHVGHCLAAAAASGDAAARQAKIDELMRVLPRMAKD